MFVFDMCYKLDTINILLCVKFGLAVLSLFDVNQICFIIHCVPIKSGPLR